MQSITVATASNTLVTYRFSLDANGKFFAIEDQQDVSKIDFTSIVTNFSLDKSSLLSVEEDIKNEQKCIKIASIKLTD